MANWIELYTPGDSALVVLARSYRIAAQAAAASAGADAAATAADRIQTGLDRTATAADRIQTSQDRAATAADRVQTGLDRTATAADRIQTGLDRTSATGSASTATTQAGIATTQAGIATTQATAALGSAQAAAASVPATADRTVGRRLNDTAIWSVIRATPAWGFGVTGSLEETPVDTLRWEYGPVTLAPLGAAFAGQGVNIFPNPHSLGLVPGVLGSGGALPTGWFASNANGITSVASASEAGMVGFDLTITGNGVISPRYEFRADVASSTTCALSFFARVVSGNANNFFLRGVTGPGNVVSPNVIGPRSATLTRMGVVHATGAADTNMRMDLFTPVAPANGEIIVIRVLCPQLVVRRFIEAPILPPVGTLGVSTRAQGLVDIPVQQLGARWNLRQGVLIVDWNSQPGPFTSAADADWFGLISWGDRAANERMGILINPAHTALEARVTAGGVAQTASSATIAAPSAGVTTRAAVAWDLDAGFLQVAGRGVAGSRVALTALPIPGWIMPGRFATTNPLFGRIQGLEVRPAALFDAALAALT